MAQIQAKWSKSGQNLDIGGHNIGLNGQMAKMMNLRPELEFSGKIWTICLNLGHFAWIWAILLRFGLYRLDLGYLAEFGSEMMDLRPELEFSG